MGGTEIKNELILSAISRQYTRPTGEKAIRLDFISQVPVIEKISETPIPVQLNINLHQPPGIPEEMRVIFFLSEEEWREASNLFKVGETYNLKVEKGGRITLG